MSTIPSLNPMVTEQATNAVNLVNSGMPYGEAISSATNGAVTPNPIGEIFTNSTTNIADTYNTLSKGAQSMMQNMGQTILPDANPLVQKFVTNAAVNTALNGGDVTKALEGSALGVGTGILGNEVTGLTSDTLGNTGAKIAGNAASTLATGAVTGQDLGDFFAAAGGSPVSGSRARRLTSSTEAKSTANKPSAEP